VHLAGRMEGVWSEVLTRAHALLDVGELDAGAELARRVREEAYAARERYEIGTTERRQCTLMVAEAHVVLSRVRRCSRPPLERS
jgi:hypothetical protein